MNWQDKNPTLIFEELVAMYINDCMQYLKTCPGVEPDLVKEEFERTTNQDLIYYGLRELKDLCMYKAGVEPQNWKD